MSSLDHPSRHGDVSSHLEDHSPRYDLILSGYPMDPNVRSAIYSTKLSNGQTRVVRLSRGALHDPIECALEVVSLDVAGDYEALSWCWGNINPATDPFITVNGSQYQIPANLEPALRHMRHTDKDRLLWCDVISINQIDASEKAVQVARMSDIYRTADEVLVWLGERDDDSRLAIATINYLVEQLRRKDTWEEFEQQNAMGDKHLPEFRKWLREKQLVPSSSPFDPRPWVACSRLLQRPWFNRLWVIQEVCQGKHSVILAGSDHTCLCRLDVFTNIAPYLLDAQQEMPMYGEGYKGMHCPIISYIRNYRDAEREPLLNLLWRLRHQRCTIPQDRIYAILSMHQEVSIKVDYTVPAWTLFRDLTIQFIKESHSLEALTACVPAENVILDCPSWVPDWSIDSENRPQLALANIHIEGIPSSTEQAMLNKSRFCASGSREVEVVSLTERKLTARGLLLTTVAKTAPSWSEALSFFSEGLPEGDLVLIAGIYVEVCRQSVLNAKSDADAAVIARTLYAGSSTFLSTTVSKNRSVKSEDIERFALKVCDPNAVGLVDDGDREAATHFYVSVDTACTRRRFCIGVDGNPILGPETTQVGDHVVLLLGSPLPLILRPVDPRHPELLQYTLVGDCYVDGIMHGEFLEQNETEFLDRRTFDFQLE